MTRQYGRGKGKVRWGSAIGTGLIVIVLFVIFVFAVQWFRSSKPKPATEIDSIANVLTPEPIANEVIAKAIDTESRIARLVWQKTGEMIGEAKRGTKDGNYWFEMITTLPEIDREVYYYKGWLVRQVPYDYFSMGEMYTNDDGKFIITWPGEEDEDYSSYTKIIITQHEYDGDVDPGEHLVEGEFGK